MKGQPLPNIAIYGRSGAGKSAVAQYLAETRGYHTVGPGKICREITKRLFGSEDKTILNQVNDALRTIDPDIWIRVSLEETDRQAPLIIDGLRFKSNLTFLEGAGFCLWKIESTDANRRLRLERRGQNFDWGVDADHAGEVEIEKERFDFAMANNGTLDRLRREVERGLSLAAL